MISGCSFFKEPEKETVKHIEKVSLSLKIPEPLRLYPIYYHVVTSENAENKFLEQTEKDNLPVFFCVVPDDYEKISLNVDSLENRNRQLEMIIQEYQNYYEGTEK